MTVSAKDLQLLEAAISELTNLDRGPGPRSGQSNFGTKLKGLREALGMSQTQFSQTYGIPVANIRNWEQPSRSSEPDMSARLLIAMISADPKTMAELSQKVREQRFSHAEQELA